MSGLEKLCKEYKGKHKLKFSLLDKAHQTKLHLVSGEKKVNIDNSFVKELEKLGVEYKLK